MKTIYLECNMGAAGDMLMAALYELCEQKQLFMDTMNHIFEPFGVSIEAEQDSKCGISGTHMRVLVHDIEEGVKTPAVSVSDTQEGAKMSSVSVPQEDADTPAESASDTQDSADISAESASDTQDNADISAESVSAAKEDFVLKTSPDNITSVTSLSKDTTPENTDSKKHDEEHNPAHPYEHVHEEAQKHNHKKDHVHTHSHGSTYPSILKKLSSLALPEQVRKDASAVYRLIGEAEAKVHHSSLEHIHFHEVGTLDALADVVGCSLLIYLIAPEQILCSPVHVGTGYVKCAHGVLPVPAPAAAEILKGVPCYSGSVTGELCTPTGAALLKHFVTKFSPMPPLSAEAIGYGTGTKNFPIANCLRATLGQTFDDDAKASLNDFGFPGDDAVLSISANIDDMTGEAMGLATEILMTAGAFDVYTIPVQMKKNRPGILLTCLCKPEEKDKFTGLLFLHTSTRGVRYQTFSRAKLESTFETRSTSFGDIRVKKSTGYGVKKEKAEFEDLKDVVLKNDCKLSAEDIRTKVISEGKNK